MGVAEFMLLKITGEAWFIFVIDPKDKSVIE
jgi:hypothetical protein